MLIGVKIECGNCEQEMVQNGPTSSTFVCAKCLCLVKITVVVPAPMK
jgi:transcription initiation factor TFIIIB Brf1 subunit/transcription initiation factor TFIIB